MPVETLEAIFVNVKLVRVDEHGHYDKHITKRVCELQHPYRLRVEHLQKDDHSSHEQDYDHSEHDDFK